MIRQKRVLTVFVLAMLNVSVMASLRNLPLVAEFGLSALTFFFLVGLFFLIPCALISAELATGWPKQGGIYAWVREGLGDRWGFMAIWMQWVHDVAWFPVILSFVAVTSTYLIDPTLASNRHFVLGVILVGFWGMTLLNYLGIQISSWFSTVGVILGTLLPGLFIIALGISWVLMGKPIHTPLSVDALIPSFQNLDNLVFLAGLFLAFAGLEVTAAYAKDVQQPQKNYPRAIILSALITFVLFMLGSLAIAVVMPKAEISIVEGVMGAFRKFLSHYELLWLLPAMALLMIIGALAEINSWIIGPIRGLHATSTHGNLPPFFKKLNTKGVPTRLLLFQALLVSFVSLIFLYLPRVSSSFWMLTALSAQSYLVMYILMFITAVRLRYKNPLVARPYRVPFGNAGMWLLCCMGTSAALFAIALAFIPPASLNVGNTTIYVLLLVSGLFAMCALPLIIHSFKKGHWGHD